MNQNVENMREPSMNQNVENMREPSMNQNIEGMREISAGGNRFFTESGNGFSTEPERLWDILSAHAAKYPLMQPQDAVKLVYQNEFGGGHLVKDEADSLQRLRDEWQQVHSAHNGFQCTGNVSPCPESVFQRAGNVVPWENIGNGFARIYLSGLDTSVYSLEQFNHDFVRSGQMHSGTMHHFLQKLEILRRMAEQNMFSFAPEELQQFLETYIAAGCPMVSHSAVYRAAYIPAYRVIQCRTCAPLLINRILALELRCENALESLCENFPEAHNGTSDKTSDEISNVTSDKTFDEISNAMSNGTSDKTSVVIAIDGRCASGKSTFAAQLAQRYHWNLIHMDDSHKEIQSRDNVFRPIEPETHSSLEGHEENHEDEENTNMIPARRIRIKRSTEYESESESDEPEI